MRIKPLEPHVPGEPGQTRTQMKLLYWFLAAVSVLFLWAMFLAAYGALEVRRWD